MQQSASSREFGDRMSLKTGIIRTGISVLGGIYNVMKKSQLQDRVLIMSRQGNEPSLDIEMLDEELRSRNIETVVLCKKLGGGAAGAIAYMGELFKQMKYLASSKVVVLDSYNIPVSILKHRDETKVIQMWHALGAMKKFGKSILDMPEGSSSEIANVMKMHSGYDYIFTSSEASRKGFAEAFGYAPEKLTVMSLPRVDALLDKERQTRTRNIIKSTYSMLMAPETIVYAPTLRTGKDMTKEVEALIDAIDTEKYNLVIKMHPLTQVKLEGEYARNVIIDKKFQTIDMFSIADYVITDYSAMTYEASLMGLPIYFYAFDKDEYLAGRTFYLDYDKDMPGPICETADQVAKEISSSKKLAEYQKKSNAFADKYIEKRENCTKEIADLIEELL